MNSSRVWVIKAYLWMHLALRSHQTRSFLTTQSHPSMSVVSQPKDWVANWSRDLRVDSSMKTSPEVTYRRTQWSKITPNSRMGTPQVCCRENRLTGERTSTSRTYPRAANLPHHLRTVAPPRLSGCTYDRVNNRFHPHLLERRVDRKYLRVGSKP